MDSMRNLHRSLPGSTPRPRKSGLAPPQDLIQAFKSAALSVTNLYKLAAEELAAERQAGYQDAIYDLLSLLDKENIGIESDEGRRIRQWATDRQESGPSNPGASDDEEEKDEEKDDSKDDKDEERDTDGETIQAAEPSSEGDLTKDQPVHGSPTTEAMRPPSQTHSMQTHPPQAEQFVFQAPHPYPASDEMDSSSNSNSSHTPSGASRTQPLHNRHTLGMRSSRRPAQLSRSGARQRLGAGAGNKRKVQLNDFFDLGSLTFGKDFPGGGSKRPRPL